MVWMNCKQFATDNREAPEGNNLNGYVLEAMKEDLVNEFGEAWNYLWIHLDCSMEEGAREFSGNLGFGFEDNDMRLYCWNKQRSYAE